MSHMSVVCQSHDKYERPLTCSIAIHPCSRLQQMFVKTMASLPGKKGDYCDVSGECHEGGPKQEKHTRHLKSMMVLSRPVRRTFAKRLPPNMSIFHGTRHRPPCGSCHLWGSATSTSRCSQTSNYLKYNGGQAALLLRRGASHFWPSAFVDKGRNEFSREACTAFGEQCAC